MKLRRYAGDIAALLVLCAALAAVFFPYIFILIASIKDVAAINRPLEWNFTPTLANWASVVRSDIPRQAWNSLLVGAWTAAISLVAGAPAAYAFSRFRVGGDVARFAVLSAQMLPPAVLIVPLFLLMYTTRLLNTLWAVTAAHLTFILPFVVWFLIGFFDDIPRELEEQAMVDGCTPWQAFYRVLLPTARPGLGANVSPPRKAQEQRSMAGPFGSHKPAPLLRQLLPPAFPMTPGTAPMTTRTFGGRWSSRRFLCAATAPLRSTCAP